MIVSVRKTLYKLCMCVRLEYNIPSLQQMFGTAGKYKSMFPQAYGRFGRHQIKASTLYERSLPGEEKRHESYLWGERRAGTIILKHRFTKKVIVSYDVGSGI
jgi:hypothetical protein